MYISCLIVSITERRLKDHDLFNPPCFILIMLIKFVLGTGIHMQALVYISKKRSISLPRRGKSLTVE